jgi:hypothetical protein
MMEDFIILIFISSIIMLLMSFIMHLMENGRMKIDLGSDAFQISSVMYSIGSFGILLTTTISFLMDVFT